MFCSAVRGTINTSVSGQGHGGQRSVHFLRRLSGGWMGQAQDFPLVDQRLSPECELKLVHSLTRTLCPTMAPDETFKTKTGDVIPKIWRKQGHRESPGDRQPNTGTSGHPDRKPPGSVTQITFSSCPLSSVQ